MSEELMPCPFCGGEGILTECVDAVLVQCQDCLATATGTDAEEAIGQWNFRTPEPMTSVVQWIKYDGSEETLPDEDRDVIATTRYGGEPIMCNRKGDEWISAVIDDSVSVVGVRIVYHR